MAEAVTARHIAATTPQPYQSKVDSGKVVGDQQEGLEISFGDVLSSMPSVGLAIADQFLKTDSTLQIKQADTRSEVAVKQTSDKKVLQDTKSEAPVQVVKKVEKEAAKAEIPTDLIIVKEAEDLSTTQAEVALTDAKTQKVEEEFSFVPIVDTDEDLTEEVSNNAGSIHLAMMQQGTTTEKTLVKGKYGNLDTANTGESRRAALLANADSSLRATNLAPEETLVADSKIIAQMLNRTPQPVAMVQVMNQPVAAIPLLTSPVPLQIERVSPEGQPTQTNLLTTPVDDGGKAQFDGNEGFSQEHSGSFSNQRSSETAGPRLEKTTESLSQTSTQQAEKVQALQQVIQDFKTQLSKISNRPTNLKISVKHEKFGNVEVKLRGRLESI